MVNKSSVRTLNKARFERCLELREQGLSYREIREVVPVAKSTLQNWLTFSGLTLTKKHLEIQLHKRIQNHESGMEAARLTREAKTHKEVQEFLNRIEHTDTLLTGGCLLYEAEGSKSGVCKFSNSDYRLINYFVKFIQKYFDRDLPDGFKFRLYIHKNREWDLERVLKFWSSKILIPKESIAISWKTHQAELRSNKDYVGQMSVAVRKSTLINRQIRSFCNIILGT